MDFDLSADQEALRDAVDELLTAHDARRRARALVDTAASPGEAAGQAAATASPGYDVELWRQAVAQGWVAVAVPADHGGLGLGEVEVAVLAERIGAHVAPVPALSGILAASALVAALADPPERASSADVAAWLARLVDGSAVGCLAWEDGPVIDAPHADLVVHVSGGQVVAYPLDGARPRPEPALDGTRRVGYLDPLPTVGIPLGGGALATELLDRAVTVYAAEMLGIADRLLTMTVEYAKVREQFGRPIGSFQAVKHRLAEMLVDVEGMRSAAYYAAWAVSTAADDRALAASTAKAWCADASRRVADGALQLHGGIGFTWEHDLHLFLKRALLDQAAYGDARFHRRRIGRLLADRVTAGQSLW